MGNLLYSNRQPIQCPFLKSLTQVLCWSRLEFIIYNFILNRSQKLSLLTPFSGPWTKQIHAASLPFGACFLIPVCCRGRNGVYASSSACLVVLTRILAQSVPQFLLPRTQCCFHTTRALFLLDTLQNVPVCSEYIVNHPL